MLICFKVILSKIWQMANLVGQALVTAFLFILILMLVSKVMIVLFVLCWVFLVT